MRETTIQFLNDNYPINKFIEEYIKYRNKPITNLYKQYTVRNGMFNRTIIPIQFIADNYMQYILDFCLKEFKINLITKDNETLKYV